MTIERLIAAASAALLLTLPAQAQTPPAADSNLTTLKIGEHAERLVEQDRLRASLRVELAGPDPVRLQADINKRMADAVARAKNVASVKIETGSYYVHEDRRGAPAHRWRGQQILTLMSKDTQPLLALAGELQQAGLVFSGLGYDLSPEATRAVEDELTAEALRRLNARAERVAQEMGLKIVRMREVRVGTTAPPRLQVLRAVGDAVAASQAPVAEPGETPVRVNVEADVLLGSR